MKKTVMQRYAKLIARKGVNVKKGQDVLVNAGLDQPEFVKMVVEECYRAGAKKVTVEWSYQPVTKAPVGLVGQVRQRPLLLRFRVQMNKCRLGYYSTF